MQRSAVVSGEQTLNASSLRRRLLRALASAGIVLPAGLALNYLLNVILARVMSVEGYGTFAFAQSLAAILATAAALGFSTSMMRFVTAYRANDELQLLRGLLTSSFSLISLVAGSMVLLLLAVGGFLPEYRTALCWAAVLLVPLTIDVWRECSMRGLHRTTAAILPRQVLLPLLTLGAILGLGMRGTAPVLTTFAVTLVMLEIFGLLQLRHGVRFLAGSRSARRLGHWLRVSLPMGGAALLQLGINRWDIVVLGFVIGLDAAGPYAAAARTALLASLVLRVVNLVVGPLLAELYQSGDRARFRRLLVGAAAGAALAGLPPYLLVMLRPDWVLLLFGDEYLQAGLMLQILATGQFVNLITGPAGLALSMSQHERANLWITAVGAAGSLLGLVLLLPHYGAVGAALATSTAVAGMNLAQVGVCVRVFSHRNASYT